MYPGWKKVSKTDLEKVSKTDLGTWSGVITVTTWLCGSEAVMVYMKISTQTLRVTRQGFGRWLDHGALYSLGDSSTQCAVRWWDVIGKDTLLGASPSPGSPPPLCLLAIMKWAAFLHPDSTTRSTTIQELKFLKHEPKVHCKWVF